MQSPASNDKTKENRTHNHEGSRSIETDPKTTKMMQLKDKNLKLVIINSVCKVKENTNMTRRESKDVKNWRMELLERKNTSYSRVSISVKQ